MPEEENIQEPSQVPSLTEQDIHDFMDLIPPPRSRVTRRNPTLGFLTDANRLPVTNVAAIDTNIQGLTPGDGLMQQIRAAEPFFSVDDAIRASAHTITHRWMHPGERSSRTALVDPENDPTSLYYTIKKEVVIDSKKKIKLFDGTFCFYEDCVDVYKLGYFKKSDDRIVKDYLAEYYIVKDPVLVCKYYGSIMGVVTEVTTKGEFVIGGYTFLHTSSRVYTNSKEHITKEMEQMISRYVVDPKLITNSTFNYYYKEDLNTGDFFHKNMHNVKDLKPRVTTQYRKCKKIKSFKKYVQDKPNTYIKMLGKKYTFGYEIETASGYLPPRLDQIIFYDAVHDGSLRNAEGNVIGGEYVTDVLWGDLGLLQLRLLCNELSKRCTINKTCGEMIATF